MSTFIHIAEYRDGSLEISRKKVPSPGDAPEEANLILEAHGVKDFRFTTPESLDREQIATPGGSLLRFSLEEADTSYEAYVRSKLRDFDCMKGSKEAAFASVFLDELNHQPFREEEFAKALCAQHPTLQQLFFRLVRYCFRLRATERPYSDDDRNRGAVRMCSDLAPLMDKYPLPIR